MAISSKVHPFPGKKNAAMRSPAHKRFEAPAAASGEVASLLAMALLDDGPPALILAADGTALYENLAFERIKRALAAAGKLPGTRGHRSDAENGMISLLVNGQRESYLRHERVLHHENAELRAHIFDPVNDQSRLQAQRDYLAKRLDDITRLVSDWVWETDSALHVSFASRRITKVMGLLPEQVIGRPLASLAEGDNPKFEAIIARKGRSAFRDIEIEMRDAAGESRWFSLSGLPVYHEQTGDFLGLRGTAQDVTDLRTREETMRHAKEAAEIANRAKSEFLANMSHELRTPLNAVIGFSEVMQGELLGPIDNPQYTTYVNDIHESASHLLSLINDILDIAKIESGSQQLIDEVVDPYQLVTSVSRLISERCERAELDFKLELPRGIPMLQADGRKLKQVLINLLSNAAKFTPAGGEITLGASLPETGEVIFTVRDNGIGIHESDLPLAFQPFAQVDSKLNRQFEGSGLGLPLSLQFMRLHGGDLWLESKPGKGTLACVSLPPDRVIAES